MSFTGKPIYDVPFEFAHGVDDVSDLVGLIAPFDVSLLDAIGSPRMAAKSTRHEWEGGENFTQIFTECVTISGSMDAVGLHAVEREFDYQVIQRLRELMRSLGQAVICGLKTSAETRRTMSGLLQFIPAHDAGGTPLTEELLNARIKEAGSPTAIVCGGFYKRKIAQFNQSSRKYEPESAALRNVVDVYESDVGVQRVILSRWCPADNVLLLNLDKLQVMPLTDRSFHLKSIAQSGDFKKSQLVGEYTLEVIAGDHGVIANLATA